MASTETLPLPPAAVLFDFDGTLCDSEAGIVSHLRDALVTTGLPVPSEELLRSCVGPPWESGGLAHIGVPVDRNDEVVAAYRATYNEAAPTLTPPFPGISDALDALVESGIVLAVATSKPQTLIDRIMAHSPLADRINVTVGADVAVGRRTKADVVGHTLGLLSQQADRGKIVMVGDRSFDVLGAAAHGLSTIGVRWGAAPAGELEEAGAAAIVETPAALVDLLLAR